MPRGEVTRGFHPFRLDASAINYQPIEHNILIQALRTGARETLGAQDEAEEEERLENYLVHALADFDDISYDEHADMLYALAGQMVEHLKDYLPDETAVRNVLKHYRRPLADFIHAQMLSHQWEKVQRYDVEVRKGFTELKECAFTASADEPIRDFRLPVEDKSRIGQIIFGGFQRCLYPVQKFQSDPERRLAVILDREAQKWFKPVLGQFQIFWKDGHEQREYQPDFVAETPNAIYLIEVKKRGEIESQEVQAKKDAAVNWCQHATQHALSYGGKSWRYLLIPHDSIADNMSLDGMAAQFLINRLI